MKTDYFKQLLIAVVALLCSVVASAHDFEVDGIFYSISGNNVTVTYKGNHYDSYNEYWFDVVIPESVTYNGITYSVTSIGYGTFRDCSGLTSVEIPNSVTSIGGAAFRGCSGLTSVEIPNSVTSIGEWAFYDCSGLTSVTIPNSVTSIGERAFYGCSGLKTVINLSSLSISDGSTDNGYVGYYADKVINAPNGFIEGGFILAKIDGVNTLVAYLGNDAELRLPANYNGENYVIGSYAFYGCSGLTSVEIPNSVTSIGSYAFYGCSGLSSVEIPNSVKRIGEGVFCYCSGLTSVEIPNSVTSIGAGAFEGCSGLTSVEIPNSVTSIGGGAFYGCSGLTSVEIPNSVTGIGGGVFEGCSGLTSVTIGNSVTRINYDVFKGCTSLKDLRIEDGTGTLFLDNEYYYDGVGFAYYISLFNDSPLQTLYLGRNIESNIDEGVSPFGSNALGLITIGNSVTSIGSIAFYRCRGLKTVINLSSLSISKGSTDNGYVGCYANKVINAPNGFIEGDFILAKIDGVNTLAAYLGNDTELTLPANYNGENYVIGSDAFRGCSGLASVEIPNSVTSVGNDAFRGCSGLASVEIPNSVTSVGNDAFRGCSGLTSVEIPNSVTSVGNDAFYGCSGLKSVTFNCKRVGDFFGNNSNISEIVFGDNVVGILENAFGGYSGIKSIKCTSAQPPKVGGGNFTSTHYQNVVLYVPKGSLTTYQAADVWKEFWEIEEFETTGVEVVEDDAPAFEITAGGIRFTGAQGKAIAIYTTSGALVEKIDSYVGEEIILEKGVYIVSVGNKSIKVKL